MAIENANDNENTSTTAVGALVIVLAIISVALRFYTRHYTRAGFGWDDWLVLLALIATIATDVMVLYATAVNPNGASVASNEDPYHEYTHADVLYTKLSFFATVLYFTITSATKLSILFLYNRLFSVSNTFRYQVVFVGILVVVFWIGCTVADLLNCRPLKWTWVNSLDQPEYCFNYNIFWMVSGVVEAFIDVLIVLMPVRMIVGLHLNLTKKIALTAIFLLGIFVIVTGIVKVVFSYVPNSRLPSFDRTMIWTTVHCGIGMVCACLPVCWPLITRITKNCTTLALKQWHRLSGWTLIGNGSKRECHASDIEREITPNPGNSLYMDDLGHRRVNSQESV